MNQPKLQREIRETWLNELNENALIALVACLLMTVNRLIGLAAKIDN